MTLQFLLHYGMHFIMPFAIAYVFYKNQFWRASIVFLLAILIDIDHLWANPIFDPTRCSIGFHFFHSYGAMGLYVVLLFFKKTRLFGLALLWHILTDALDCLWM